MPWVSQEEGVVASVNLLSEINRERINVTPRREPYNSMNSQDILSLFLRLSSISFNVAPSNTVRDWVIAHGPELDFFQASYDGEEPRPHDFLRNFHNLILQNENLEILRTYIRVIRTPFNSFRGTLEIVERYRNFLEDPDIYAIRCFEGPIVVQEESNSTTTEQIETQQEAIRRLSEQDLEPPRYNWNLQGITTPPSGREVNPETGWRRRNRERNHNRVSDLHLWYSECYIKYKDRLCYVRDFMSSDPEGNDDVYIRLYRVNQETGRIEDNSNRVKFIESLLDFRIPPIGWALYPGMADSYIAEFFKYQVGGYRRGISARNLYSKIMLLPDGSTGRGTGSISSVGANALFNQRYIPIEQGIQENKAIFLVNPVIAIQKVKNNRKVFFNDIPVGLVDELKTKKVIRLDNKFKTLSKVISRMTQHETK